MSGKKSTDTLVETKKDDRVRAWSFILYPDSLPNDWLHEFENLQIPVCISPLHDKDVNELDEEQKKPHYHVIMYFEGKKSFNQVKDISVGIFHGTIPKKVNSIKGATRYLTHMDNPEKYPYKQSEVKVLYGYEYDKYIDISNAMRYELIGEMYQFIEFNDINYYCDLVAYAQDNREDWFHLLCDNSTYCISCYIKDRNNKMRGR